MCCMPCSSRVKACPWCKISWSSLIVAEEETVLQSDDSESDLDSDDDSDMDTDSELSTAYQPEWKTLLEQFWNEVFRCRHLKAIALTAECLRQATDNEKQLQRELKKLRAHLRRCGWGVRMTHIYRL